MNYLFKMSFRLKIYIFVTWTTLVSVSMLTPTVEKYRSNSTTAEDLLRVLLFFSTRGTHVPWMRDRVGLTYPWRTIRLASQLGFCRNLHRTPCRRFAPVTTFLNMDASLRIHILEKGDALLPWRYAIKRACDTDVAIVYPRDFEYPHKV